MSKKKLAKAKISSTKNPSKGKKVKAKMDYSLLPWLFLVAGITAICLFPILKNEFVNWDDEYYVINNPLLRGPDWKGIFSEQVLGNYHPLTILSYAFNYAISGLDPFSYLLVNYLFHLVNTILVFYFIKNISGDNKFIAAFVALIFGIHPMHIESVAWVAERKDVLYTFFFMLALLRYWKFLLSNKQRDFWICFILFVLSLLSKPAAIVLPLVLLLLDYWKGRSINGKLIIEKLPFFAFSLIFGIVTVNIQSSSAMAGLSVFTITDRLFFACYSLMTYFFRFFVPYPMSALHPFPSSGNLSWQMLASPLFVVAMLAALWFMRKNKVVVFGILFYVINLLLVLQVISIGLSIISERYTYVPYIGLSFMIATLISRVKFIPAKVSVALGSMFLIVLAVLAFQRTLVWRNSGTLWSDSLKTYPNSPYARTNRANYLSKIAARPDQKPYADSIYKVAFDDCAIALSVKSNHAPAYRYRSLMYLDRQQFKEGLADANELIRLKPNDKDGYDTRATAYYKLNDPAKALADYEKCVSLAPNDHRSHHNRGVILMNSFQKYNEAMAAFNKAINMQHVNYYFLNRSICYLKLKDTARAREDALRAQQLGSVIPDAIKTSLQIK